MKKRIINLIVLSLFSVAVLYGLNLSSGKPNTHKNGFSRNFAKVIVKEVGRIRFDASVSKVCSVNGDSLFFSGSIPGKIYLATQDFKKRDTFNLHLPTIPLLSTDFSTYVDYPNVYIVGGNARIFIAGNLKTGQYEQTKLKTNGPFGNTVMLTPTSYITREIDDSTYNACFTKVNVATGMLLRENNLSIPLQDAGFVYDGMLHYDKTANRALFIPFYNNNIISFDSSFTLLYRSHTIDTIATARRHIIVKKRHAVTYNEPPTVTNGNSWIFGNSFFVISRLQADNEINGIFTSNRPVDEYDIRTGQYISSFLLPIVPGQKLITIVMTSRDKFFGLYERDIIQYVIAIRTNT